MDTVADKENSSSTDDSIPSDIKPPEQPRPRQPVSARLWILLASIAAYIILFIFISWETKVFALRIIALQCVSIPVIAAASLIKIKAKRARYLSLPEGILNQSVYNACRDSKFYMGNRAFSRPKTGQAAPALWSYKKSLRKPWS